jgi:hypothetical protein
VEVSPAGRERRDQPEHRACDHPDREREQQDGGVHANALGVADRRRAEAHEVSHRSGRQCQSERRSAGGQQKALAQHVAHEPPLARAERETNGEFALAARCPHQREVREVGAGDEQQHAHGAEQQKQRLPPIAIPPLVQRHDHRRQGALGQRPLGGDTCGQRRHLGVKRAERRARPETPDDLVIECAAVGRWLELVRLPVVGMRWLHERGGQDADHGRRDAVQVHRTADDRRVSTEPATPQRLAEDDDGRLVRSVLVRRERASEQRTDTHHGEVGRRDGHAADLFRAGAQCKHTARRRPRRQRCRRNAIRPCEVVAVVHALPVNTLVAQR